MIMKRARSFALALADHETFSNRQIYVSPSSSSTTSSLSNDTVKRHDIGHRSLQWIHFLQNIK